MSLLFKIKVILLMTGCGGPAGKERMAGQVKAGNTLTVP